MLSMYFPNCFFHVFYQKNLHNILKDQNAHGKSSIWSICLSLLGQQFHDNHSRWDAADQRAVPHLTNPERNWTMLFGTLLFSKEKLHIPWLQGCVVLITCPNIGQQRLHFGIIQFLVKHLLSKPPREHSKVHGCIWSLAKLDAAHTLHCNEDEIVSSKANGELKQSRQQHHTTHTQNFFHIQLQPKVLGKMPAIDRSCGWTGYTYDSYNTKKKKSVVSYETSGFFPGSFCQLFSLWQWVEMKPHEMRPRIPIMKSRKTRPKFAISATDSWLWTNSSPRLGPTSTPPRRYPKINGCLGSSIAESRDLEMGKPHDKKK